MIDKRTVTFHRIVCDLCPEKTPEFEGDLASGPIIDWVKERGWQEVTLKTQGRHERRITLCPGCVAAIGQRAQESHDLSDEIPF